MKAITHLLIGALFFGALIACNRHSLAAAGSDPKVNVKIARKVEDGQSQGKGKHHRNVGLMATNTVTSTGLKNRVRWESDKEFSIILPITTDFAINAPIKGSTNSDTHFFDPNSTLVIVSAGGFVELEFTNPPTNGTAKYHIAVHKPRVPAQSGPAPLAVYYNYDMMEATLNWDDISTRED